MTGYIKQNMVEEIESNQSLHKFLDSKGVEYKSFDKNRFKVIYKRIAHCLPKPAKTIQVIGTNGKGSTVCFLSQMLQNSGFNVGSYTSPHLFQFNERICINLIPVEYSELESQHKDILNILTQAELQEISFFEYMTLLGYMYLASRCDYLILEAGLGGEFDATTVFPKNLLLICEIDVDHAEFLGDSIEAIAKTKLEAMNCDTIVLSKKDIVAQQANLNALSRGFDVMFINEYLEENEQREIEKFALDRFSVDFLCNNLKLAASGFKYFGFKIQASIMPKTKPRGRFEIFLPNVTIDVGHNPACALAIRHELNNKKVQLVYNTMKDKDYQASLMVLRDNIAEVEIIDIDGERVLERSKLESFLSQNGFVFRQFSKILPEKEYLVFGSFVVAQKFIELLETKQ